MTKYNPTVVLYDGVCGLCNESVKFIITHDPAAKFKFAPFQSALATQLLKPFPHIHPEQLNTVVLVNGQQAYTKSAAILRIVKEFPGLWKGFYILSIIPSPILDFFYDIVARNRYRWFGKTEHCLLPTPEIKARFITE